MTGRKPIETAPMAYIGRAKDGKVVAVVVDDGDDFTRDAVNEYMQDGLTIERVTVEWARENLFTYNEYRPDLPND